MKDLIEVAVDKRLCPCNDGLHCDQHPSRRKRDTPSIKQDGRKIAWKKERNITSLYVKKHKMVAKYRSNQNER